MNQTPELNAVPVLRCPPTCPGGIAVERNDGIAWQERPIAPTALKLGMHGLHLGLRPPRNPGGLGQ